MELMTSKETEDYFDRIKELVLEALENGHDIDVYEYVAERLPIDPLIEVSVKTAIMSIVLFADHHDVTFH